MKTSRDATRDFSPIGLALRRYVALRRTTHSRECVSAITSRYLLIGVYLNLYLILSITGPQFAATLLRTWRLLLYSNVRRKDITSLFLQAYTPQALFSSSSEASLFRSLSLDVA